MVPIETLTAQYAKLREKKSQIKAEYDEKLRAVDKAIVLLESALLKTLNASGVKSARTAHGLFTITETRKYHAADWEQLYNHIMETKNFGLLQKRLGEGAVKEFIATTDGDVPPGVSFTDIVGVHFTKPKA